MKIRNGFVSNSSSSSFTISDSSHGYIKLDVDKNKTYMIGKNGEVEFGWGCSRIYDIDSRVSWAFLQAECLNERRLRNAIRPKFFSCKIVRILEYDNPIKMLYNVLTEQSGIDDVEVLISDDWEIERFGYIDHQSCVYENSDNGKIFDSMESLRDFIFGSRSYIELDNDNH